MILARSRDVAAPSIRRYAAPVRTVQRVGLFGNAKQSECIQNLDQVYPNLQKRVRLFIKLRWEREALNFYRNFEILDDSVKHIWKIAINLSSS